MMGDYYQLNPVIKSYEADKKGMSISLFRKLCERHPYKVMILRETYHMNETIASLSNTIAYKGLIRHANPEVKTGQLEFELECQAQYPWLKELKNDERKVVMVNTDNLLNKTLQKQINAMKNRNFFEVAIVLAIIDNFIKSGIKPKSIGVVTTTLD